MVGGGGGAEAGDGLSRGRGVDSRGPGRGAAAIWTLTLSCCAVSEMLSPAPAGKTRPSPFDLPSFEQNAFSMVFYRPKSKLNDRTFPLATQI